MGALGMPLKPMLGVDGLIAHSKEKGITFEIISEDEAKDYLGRNNNYFKLSSSSFHRIERTTQNFRLAPEKTNTVTWTLPT